MSNLVYNRAKASLTNGNLDWDTSVVKIALVGTSYTPVATHNFLSSVTGELAGTGYTRKTLSCTVTQDDANNRAVLGASAVTWTGINAGTVGAAVVFKDNASDAAAELITYLDITDTPTNGGDFTITFNAAGVLTVS